MSHAEPCVRQAVTRALEYKRARFALRHRPRVHGLLRRSSRITAVERNRAKIHCDAGLQGRLLSTNLLAGSPGLRAGDLAVFRLGDLHF